MIPCVRRLSEDGTPVPKYVVVITIMNLLYYLYFILLSTRFVQYIELTRVNINKTQTELKYFAFISLITCVLTLRSQLLTCKTL